LSTYYVTIDNSYSATGSGIKTSPLNWNQFTSVLSSNTTEDIYCLSGTYSASNINIFSPKQIYLSSDDGNPWIIRAPSSTITLSAFESIYIVNGFVAASTISFNATSGSVNFDNVLLSLSANLNLVSLSGATMQASTISNNNLSLNLNFSGTNQTFNFFNNILMLKNINDKSINSFNTYNFHNNVITSAISAYSFWNGFGNTFIDSNNQPNWIPLSAFTSLTTIQLNSTNLNYLTSSFSAISASVALGYDPYPVYGITKSTNTFYDGRRDGVGALYFPLISGVAVSASSATSPVGVVLNYILSGNNPFTIFSASSATYTWDDGTSNSAINSNSILAHSFSANGSYQVGSTILSRNKWYSVEANTKTILAGVYVIITIFKKYSDDDITNGYTNLLTDLTMSATVFGFEVGSYDWDFGDGSILGDSNPENKFYMTDGIKNVKISAYSLEDSDIFVTNSANITVSAISAEYYVNIISAYDVCANNVGTSEDPFNWLEFKGRVETSGDYLDTYKLSGSRTLNRIMPSRISLNIDSACPIKATS
jgi:hypothetical protein